MKLFRRKEISKKLKITEVDQFWVEDSFECLISIYGYPESVNIQYALTSQYFPLVFNSKTFNTQLLLNDLLNLLNIEKSQVEMEFVNGIQDLANVPYVVEGGSFESEVIYSDTATKIFVANHLVNNPGHFLHVLIKAVLKIKLLNDGQDVKRFEDFDFESMRSNA